jgi:hypothetical protein
MRRKNAGQPEIVTQDKVKWGSVITKVETSKRNEDNPTSPSKELRGNEIKYETV